MMSKRAAAGILLLLVLLELSQTSYGNVECKTSKEQKRCGQNADCAWDKKGDKVCKCNTGYIGDGYICEHLPSNLVNVAYRRPALQSSTSDELKYAATNAVDGDRNGKVEDKSCSQTDYTNNQWWRVDLGKSLWVEKVLIANQRNPHHKTLDDVDIRIGDHKGVARERNPLCRQGLQVPKKPWLYSCAEPMLGKYVYIILNKKEKLTLCEVEVYVNGEAIDVNIGYLVPRVQGKFLEKASDVKYAGNDHFYFKLKQNHRKDIVIDLPPRKDSLRSNDPVVMPFESVKVKCGPNNHEMYLNGTFLGINDNNPTYRVNSFYTPQGEEKKKQGTFSCKWEDLRVRGDICRLETKCSAKHGTQCDTTYISSSFPPGAYHCACINGFVPSSKPLPGNVVLPGERCVKKSPQGLEIRHSKQNVALGMKTTVSSTDNYAGCKKKDCKEIPAFGRFVVDGRIKTCFRSLTEHNPWLMVHLNDYYPISLVRITTSARSLHNVKVYVASENNLQLCAFYSGKLQGNRLVSFGCSQLYTYGNDVKIETTHSSILNLCEVEIYADTYVNIALNQFSESKPKSSRLANDGNLGSCFTASYWYLELGANVRVSVVFILHKRSTNLEGFDIVVGEGEKKDLCTTIPKYSHKNDQGNYFECKEAVVGKFLSLTLTRGRQRQISLCEVEVFQTKTINLAAKRPTRSSTNSKASKKGCDQKISETFSTAGAAKNIPAWWSVDLRAICKVHLVRVVTSEKYKPADLKNLMIKVNVDAGFNKGKSVASLKNPTQEPVQTLTLPKDTKARYVTIELKKLHTSSKLDFREVEIYNGPLLDVNECDRPGVKCSGNFRCQDHLYKYTCECDGGFKLTGPSNNECTDIDECLSNPCHVDASCSNTHGSFKCTCNHGFAGDGRKVCSGLKPCLTDQDCRENQFCKEIKGSRLCDCKEGYIFKNMTCVDANECELEKDICGSNSVCTNSEGSYKCNCVGGYESKTDDGKNCFDIDECKTANCGDVATCENTEGSFHCECPEGFSFDKKERECYDIDECSVSGSCGPNQLCSNEMGTYSCPCRTGYREIKNPRRCIDIDECEIDDYKCPEYSKCDNKDGGYDCPCKTGYKKTQQGACSEICVPKCERNSYCVNGQCLCETGFFLGLDRKCQASLHGSGISPQSSAALLTAALLWCLALM
ncbi:uncharacterized protein LOC144658099 isoform X3 [Oculina patagonica]